MPHPVLINGGTSKEWDLENPILPANITGTETDTLRTKIGNGSSFWNSLKYTDEPSGHDILALAVSNAIKESDKDENIGVDSSHNWGEQIAADIGKGLFYFPDIKNTAYSDGSEFIRQASLGSSPIKPFIASYESDEAWAGWALGACTKSIVNGVVKLVSTSTAFSYIKTITGTSRRIKFKARVLSGVLTSYRIGVGITNPSTSDVNIAINFPALNEWLELDVEVPISQGMEYVKIWFGRYSGASIGDTIEIEYYDVGDYSADTGALITTDAIAAANDSPRVTTVTAHPTDAADYTSIALAIAAVYPLATKTNQYTIEFDGTHTDAITMRNYVNLKGRSKETSIINVANLASASDAEISALSAVNFNANATIENCSIFIKNGRYAVHPDGGTYGCAYYYTAMKNVHAEHLGNQEVVDYRVTNSLPAGSPWSVMNAWGSGTSYGQVFDLEDCELIGWYDGLSVHNNTYPVLAPATVNLTRCKIQGKNVISGGFGVSIQSIGSKCRDIIKFIDCEIDGNIVYNVGSGYLGGTVTTQVEWDVTKVGGNPVAFINGMTTYANDKFYIPKFLDKIKSFYNGTGVDIPMGAAVVHHTSNRNIRLMQSFDTAQRFLGVSAEAIANGTSGKVFIKNQYIEAHWLYTDGVIGSNLDTNHGISTTVNGAFKASTTPVVLYGAQNGLFWF